MTIGSDLLVLLPELILAVGAMAALLIGAVWGDKSTKFLSGLVVVLMAVATYFALTAPDATAFHGAFVADGFARFAKALILMSAALCTLMAQAFFEDEGRVRFELPVLIALSTVGMLLMVSAANFIALYLGMELQSLALYVLASFNRYFVNELQEQDYIRYRLGLAVPSAACAIFRKLAFLVIVSRKEPR